jgi:hypothetical protein
LGCYLKESVKDIGKSNTDNNNNNNNNMYPCSWEGVLLLAKAKKLMINSFKNIILMQQMRTLQFAHGELSFFTLG